MPLDASGTVTLLQVFDIPASLHVYRDLLGYRVVQRLQPTDTRGRASLRLDDAELMLNTAYEDESRRPAPDSAK